MSDDPSQAGRVPNENAAIQGCSCSWCTIAERDGPPVHGAAGIERQDQWLLGVSTLYSEAAVSSSHYDPFLKDPSAPYSNENALVGIGNSTQIAAIANGQTQARLVAPSVQTPPQTVHNHVLCPRLFS
jgi:hypothetical protein